jgi:CBS domain-containing protein
MANARDLMTPDPACVRESDTVRTAAEQMSKLNVGSLPICGEDNRLKGMLTDRDIVVKVLAGGKDPMAVLAGELAQGEAVTIGADDDAEEILRTMRDHQVRRLPVIDGHDLVGIVALADVARALPDAPVGDLLDALSVDCPRAGSGRVPFRVPWHGTRPATAVLLTASGTDSAAPDHPVEGFETGCPPADRGLTPTATGSGKGSGRHQRRST